LFIRLYALAFWLTEEARESGRGGIAGVAPDAKEVVDAGAVKALDAGGTDMPDAVAVGVGIAGNNMLVVAQACPLGPKPKECWQSELGNGMIWIVRRILREGTPHLILNVETWERRPKAADLKGSMLTYLK
jgi:hypothetical protein